MRLSLLFTSIFTFFILALALSASALLPAHADNNLSEADKHLLDLVGRFALKPELMNAHYLEYLFGTPELKDEPNVRASQEYWWIESTNHNLLEKLTERTQPLNGAFRSRLVLIMPRDSELTFKVLENYLQIPPQLHFDQRLYRGKSFSTTDKTQVFAYEPFNRIYLREIAIQYTGDKLPAPNKADIAAAIDERRAAAFVAQEKGLHHQALPLLLKHVQENPNDLEARMHLAEAYKMRGCLNDSIAQYRSLLNDPRLDQSNHQRCVAALQELRILPSDRDNLSNPYPLGKNQSSGIKLVTKDPVIPDAGVASPPPLAPSFFINDGLPAPVPLAIKNGPFNVAF